MPIIPNNNFKLDESGNLIPASQQIVHDEPEAQFTFQEAPFVDSEEQAKQALATTGPVINGEKKSIGAQMPTPQAQPNLRQPNLNVTIPAQAPEQPGGAEVGEKLQ